MAYRELPMKVLGVAWIGVVGTRPETRCFYGQILGLPELEQTPEYGYYAVGDTTRLEVLRPGTASSSRQRADAPAIGFLVANLDRALEDLVSNGSPASDEVYEWHSDHSVHRWVYLRDPEDNVVLLVERNEGQEAT
jgi:catechol-2,3-dioxygenase